MSDVLTAKLTELDEKGLEYDEEVILILGKALLFMTLLIMNHNICIPFINQGSSLTRVRFVPSKWVLQTRNLIG